MFVFPMLGSDIAQRLGYSMVQLSSLAASGNLGMSIAEPLASISTSHFGVKRTVQVGVLLQFIGYFGLAQMYIGNITISSYWLAAAFFFSLNASPMTIMSAVYITVCSNASEETRGKMISLFITIASLSTALYVGIRSLMGYIGGGTVDTGAFLLVLTTVSIVTVGIASFGILEPSAEEYVPVENLERNTDEDSQYAKHGERTVNNVDTHHTHEDAAILSMERHKNEEYHVLLESAKSDGTRPAVEDTLVSDTQRNDNSGYGSLSVSCDDDDVSSTNLAGREDTSVGALLHTKAFWYMCLIRFLVYGGAVMYTNNVGSIARSLILGRNPHASEEELQYIVNLHAMTQSMATFVGSLASGAAADFMQSKGPIGSNWLFIGSMLLQIVSQFSMCTINSAYILLIVTASSSVAFCMFGNIYYIAAYDLWPGSNFGRNMGITSIASIAGTQLFTMAFGVIYDGNASEGCSGNACYRDAFFMGGLVYVVALLFVISLVRHLVAKAR
ncbi:major facilitator superfamily domain-containing protein [Thamnocephalis sphaerospora]|uniref:Major facilitator superfamily domain-containing protein n=1 Tax=Thamnocephalis sphaerospora TaxID=78915 RepID=A0A4P9Y088_9FUNG|nr:major facilitator superfamily domain-containing protein [Thamnocephalis sphaerospora]|eukprot:RKP11170.1 major facilitator superfamily domain-containing protein [Thamnocephalis sphaerospora]